jgi:hypothetical protein
VAGIGDQRQRTGEKAADELDEREAARQRGGPEDAALVDVAMRVPGMAEQPVAMIMVGVVVVPVGSMRMTGMVMRMIVVMVMIVVVVVAMGPIVPAAALPVLTIAHLPHAS